MTKTQRSSRPTRHTDAAVEAGWLAIEHYAMGPRPDMRPGVERVEIGSADSGFDAPPAWPPVR